MSYNSFPRRITTQTMSRNVYILLHLCASRHILSSFSHSQSGIVAWFLSKTSENLCLRARPCLKGSSTVEQNNKRKLCWISMYISTNKASSNKKRYQRRQIECSYGPTQTPSQNKELKKMPMKCTTSKWLESIFFLFSTISKFIYSKYNYNHIIYFIYKT